MQDLRLARSSLREVVVDELLVEDIDGSEHDDLTDLRGRCQVVSD